MAVGSLDSRDAGLGKLDDLPDAADFDQDRRGVVDTIGEFLALPDQFPGLLVQGDKVTLLAAWHQDHFVAIHQGHSGKTPFRQLPAEILPVVLPPDLCAGVGVGAQYFTVLADGKNQIAVSGWRAARSGESAPARCARFSDLRLPVDLAVCLADGNQVVGVAQIAHGEQTVPDDAHARVAAAQSGSLPEEFWTALPATA